MKKRERTYSCCGLVAFTFSKAEKCNACATLLKYADIRQKRLEQLQQLYDDVERAEETAYGKTAWTFTHRVCGVRQTWSDSNITKQLDLRPNEVPCSKCGAKERTAKATAASALANGIPDHLLTEWEAYRRKVRRLSEQTYRQHRSDINPLNLPRGVHTYHLDHKFPIVEGFLRNLPPEQLADVTNLQILPAVDNIVKGARTSR